MNGMDNTRVTAIKIIEEIEDILLSEGLWMGVHDGVDGDIKGENYFMIEDAVTDILNNSKDRSLRKRKEYVFCSIGDPMCEE